MAVLTGKVGVQMAIVVPLTVTVGVLTATMAVLTATVGVLTVTAAILTAAVVAVLEATVGVLTVTVGVLSVTVGTLLLVQILRYLKLFGVIPPLLPDIEFGFHYMNSVQYWSYLS